MFSLDITNSLSKQINNFQDFQVSCTNFGIELDDKQLEKFKKYFNFLTDWNKKINLVSRKLQNNEEEWANFILERNFLDSIIFSPEMAISNRSVVDIGSGAGFPGIPLAILNPQGYFTLCDSTTKKCKFLNELIKELDLKNVKVINDRVENIKSKFDIAISRALADLKTIIQYSLPVLKKDGLIAAYKSANITDELEEIKETLKREKLTFKIISKNYNGVERVLVIIQSNV